MAHGTTEKDFEDQVEAALMWQGFTRLANSSYDLDACLAPEEVLAFLRATQPDEYADLQIQYGPKADERILGELKRNLERHGLLHVMRKGWRDRGVALKLAYFQPASGLNPTHQALYAQNRFGLMRQVRYSAKNGNTLDLVLFLNGVPLLTAELKNALTGQYLAEAIAQYRRDRDPAEPLLKYKRCLVHFAVSTEAVAMTTRLAGEKTFFLPFNQDIENPVNPSGYKTAYLWQDLWAKDSLLDLLQNYVHVQTDSEKVYNETTRKLEEKPSEKLIFPRYHQRRAVQRMLDAVQTEGVGHNYLIKHSAGSGKSNTIAWLAHRLSGFYQAPTDQRTLFDAVLVVTDRRVLDKQLQSNITQFEQVTGVVAAIDEKMSSQDLKAAIERGARIIVTTLQKFPFISETITRLSDRRYAVILDEAHSSQTGEASRHLRRTLSLSQAEKEEAEDPPKDLDDLVADVVKSKGRQPNLSYFAFTATPKQKTLETFGRLEGGKIVPFDEYTMAQAIDEGFILNVLENYTTFRRYYKLAKRPDIDDKAYETRQTVRLLNSYVDLTDHAIELKSRLMLEHFVSKTQNEIQGKARAMLVTRSRLHAVRYKRKFDELMQEMRLPYQALVAFSGTVHDDDVDQDFTEVSMNQLGGQVSIPDALKMPRFRILIVANKFQTGFDEPLLHTMFVDKRLGGVNTVQTLSRLNRTTTGKTATMVLDFVNDPEQVQADFQDYYDTLFMPEEQQTDPNLLYDVQTELDAAGVYTGEEVNAFGEIFFRPERDKQDLQPILDGCAKRYKDLDEVQQVEFQSNVTDFIRLYRFLSQIITFTDVELEKRYVFLSALQKKIPRPAQTLPQEVLNEVVLDSYKLQHEYTTSLELAATPNAMPGMARGGSGISADELYDLLSNIIQTLNDAYGLNLSDEDRVDFEAIRARIEADKELDSVFNPNNTRENIRDKFEEVLDDALLEFVNTKLELYNKLSEDKANATMKRLWFNHLYDARIRGIRGL